MLIQKKATHKTLTYRLMKRLRLSLEKPKQDCMREQLGLPDYHL